ncbi:MAG: DUF2142 domain-containing protein [Planctomycetes bacterium]|nr:DUF2142 domain-containing protein [Planctomycetota bacterium]
MLLLSVLGFSGWLLSQRVLVVEIEPGAATDLKLYLDLGRGFNEADAKYLLVAPGADRARCLVPRRTFALRLDLPSRAGRAITVRSVAVQGLLGGDCRPWTGASTANQIGAAGGPLPLVCRVASEADDPWLLLDGPARSQRPSIGDLLVVAGAALVLLAAAWLLAGGTRSTSALPPPSTRLPWVLLAWVGLIAISTWLAVGSLPGNQTDEPSHVAAALYYAEPGRWFPPDFSSPAVTATILNIYGHSYLFDGDLAYLVLGKAVLLLGWTGLDAVTALRLANLVLFIGAAAASARLLGGMAWLLLALGFMPQVWYVAGYVNGDACGLAVGLVATGLAARVWRAEGCGDLVRWVLPAIAALVVLALCKTNYVVVAGLVSAVVAARLWWQRMVLGRLLLPLLAGVLLLPLAAVGGRMLATQACNGWEAGMRMAVTKEAHAEDGWKPSQRGRPVLVAGRTAGPERPLARFAFDPAWYLDSFRSLVGVYGPMVFFHPALHYLGMWGGLAALLGLMVVGAGQVGGWRRAGTLVFVLASIAGLVVAQSLGYTWTYDYQALGRYLFPGIPLVLLAGVLLCPRVPTAGAFWLLWMATLPVAWWCAGVASAVVPRS